MANLATVLAQMPPAVVAQTEVVFVSVDPERDTPERLRTWLAHFDPRFVGLRGRPEEVARIEHDAGRGRTRAAGERGGRRRGSLCRRSRGPGRRLHAGRSGRAWLTRSAPARPTGRTTCRCWLRTFRRQPGWAARAPTPQRRRPREVRERLGAVVVLGARRRLDRRLAGVSGGLAVRRRARRGLCLELAAGAPAAAGRGRPRRRAPAGRLPQWPPGGGLAATIRAALGSRAADLRRARRRAALGGPRLAARPAGSRLSRGGSHGAVPARRAARAAGAARRPAAPGARETPLAAAPLGRAPGHRRRALLDAHRHRPPAGRSSTR